jgi:hypothetical protein
LPQGQEAMAPSLLVILAFHQLDKNILNEGKRPKVKGREGARELGLGQGTLYTITILHRLSIYTSINHSLLQTSNKAIVLKLFRHSVTSLIIKTVYHKPKNNLLGASSSCCI